MSRRVLVVGGGVAGLVAARELAAPGVDVVVMEARPHTGGALASVVLDGVAIDSGAEAYGVTRPESADLVRELGLGGLAVSPRRSDARLLLAEGPHDMPPALLGVPSDLSAEAFVAVVGADAAERARTLDAAPIPELPTDISLGHLVRMRLGDPVADRLLSPVVAGVHATDPDLVEAEAVLPGLLTAMRSEGSLSAAAGRIRAAAGVPGAAIAGLHGGMTTLVRALQSDAERRGVRVRTGARVVDVVRDDGEWLVRAEDAMTGGASQHRADDVVLAVDAPAARGLLRSVGPVAQALADVTVGDVALVALVVRSDALDADPVGSGVLVAPGHPDVRAKAMTHASAKWEWIRTAYGPGRHVVRLSYGRNGVIDEDVDALADLALADLIAITGADDVERLAGCIVRWDRSLVRPAPGHHARVAQIRAACDAVPHLALVGAGLGGNGLAGTIATARSVTAQLDLA